MNTFKEFTKRQQLFFLIVTVFFSVLLFVNLGNRFAPSTGVWLDYELGDDNLSFEFEGGAQIKEVWMFLGERFPYFKIESLDSDTKENVVLADDYSDFGSVFRWNSFTADTNTDKISFTLSRITEAVINEVVFVDDNGTMVMPSNADDYPELFDEQDMYPVDKTYHNGTIFDEIYHGRTAYEVLRGEKIYETTHPMLGKILMSFGIWVFGMNPFGWRVICAVFGSLMLFAIFMFAYQISKEFTTAFIAEILVATEFMHFTLSRIATIDIIVAVFIILMFMTMAAYVNSLEGHKPFAEKYKHLLWCGFFSGCAISTKWTGFYALGGLAILFFIYFLMYCNENHFSKAVISEIKSTAFICVISFVIIPFVMYLLCYIPYKVVEPDRSLFDLMVDNWKYMLWYHSSIDATHPYSSNWYQWFLDQKVLLDAYDSITEGNRMSIIVTFANPLIVYAGPFALIHHVYLMFTKKDRLARFLVIAYSVMLLPWVFVSRVLFIYQYFACVLVLVVLEANSLRHIANRIKIRKLKYAPAIVFCAISVILFFVYLPVISGNYTGREYLNSILKYIVDWGC